MFTSEKSGALLVDQRRVHKCVLTRGGTLHQWLPRFTIDRKGNPLTEDDDREFAFQLVLEDSEKVLYENRRIARGFVKLIRRTEATGEIGGKEGGTWEDWRELDSGMPDEIVG